MLCKERVDLLKEHPGLTPKTSKRSTGPEAVAVVVVVVLDSAHAVALPASGWPGHQWPRCRRDHFPPWRQASERWQVRRLGPADLLAAVAVAAAVVVAVSVARRAKSTRPIRHCAARRTARRYSAISMPWCQCWAPMT